MKTFILLCLLPVLSIAQTQIGMDIDGEAAGDRSGSSVSLSAEGNVVAIGAPLNDGNGNRAGHVRVYQYIAGAWTQVGDDIDSEAEEDQSGVSVSISADGTIVAIGASLNDGGALDGGHVRVFQNVEGTWTQLGEDIDGEGEGDQSGWSLSLSADGHVVAIGAPSNTGSDDPLSGYLGGHVRVFQYTEGAWTQIGDDIDGEADGDMSGWSVALSADGNVVASGAIFNGGNGNYAGHVRVFENNGGNWIQVGDDIDGEAAEDQCGTSVALSADGSVVAIGSPFNSGDQDDAGHVRVFQNNSGTWTQVGGNIYGEDNFDYSGTSLSLSANGNVVAIGAPRNEGGASGGGHVRVFQNNGGSWTQVGADIDGEAGGDNSGTSVSLSADGNIVAIGAPFNNGNGDGSGHVRVFDLSSGLSSDSFVLNNFTVYPNPASDIVKVQLSEGIKLEEVNVYSTLGQLVKTGRNNVISVNDLDQGTYFLEVITNQGNATKTIIVE